MMKKKPVNHPTPPGKIARVPVVMQMETLECGAASLNMVLAYYGCFVPLAETRKECAVSRDGSTMKNIALAAKNYGLEVNAWRCSADSLKSKCDCPCILFWKHRHFIVLRGYKNKKFHVNDPALGYLVLSEYEMSAGYSGICMTFTPGKEFVPRGKQESMLAFAGKRMRRAGALSLMIILTTLILTMLGMIEPSFSRAFVDSILPHHVPEKVNIFFFSVFTIFILAKVFVLWSRNTYLVKLQGKTAIYSGSSFVWQLLRLPVDFFCQRHSGDIINRYKSNTTAVYNIIMKFVPLILDFCTLIFYFILMSRYSLLLAVISMLTFTLNITLSVIMANKRRNIRRTQLKNNAILASSSMSSLSMIESIKANGAENNVFEQWAAIYAASNNDQVELSKARDLCEAIPRMLSALSDNLILCMGIILVINGEWTLGFVTAFSQYLNAFSSPAQLLADSLASLQETRIEMERINDVMDYPTDFVCDEQTADRKKTYQFLQGDVEIRDLSFGWNRLREPLISNFSMKVPSGSRVALVGSSGSGKSTLAGLLTGLYKPWSGQVLYDGIPLEEIDRNTFTASVSSVDQQITLFRDHLKNNITMWDSTISENDVISAAKDASIYESIIMRENGFMARMTEEGRNFSGGERQRLEIARALATSPSVMILDEATSALDAETENRVMNAIHARGITMIIVSHRLSTVRDCDEIIVLKNGRVEARGKHDELMKNCAYYQGMVISE